MRAKNQFGSQVDYAKHSKEDTTTTEKDPNDKEYDEVIDYAYDIGVRNAFIQEGETQSDSFIPSFKGDMII